MDTPELREKKRVKRGSRMSKPRTRHVLVFPGGKKPETTPCDCSGCNFGVLSNSALITQTDLERWFRRKRDLACVEKRIAIALSKGAKIEMREGCHKAELVPSYGEDGHVHLKLVIR
jgi:hypothetical protein